jgi:hypothetical protein
LGVGAGAFAPHRGENADLFVDVVVDLDGGLAGVGAQDWPTYWVMLPLNEPGEPEAGCLASGS